MKTGKDKQLPSFWIPSLTPDAGPKLEEKPVSIIVVNLSCVFVGHILFILLYVGMCMLFSKF